MKVPAIQFYTGDWLKDPDVSRCSPMTRGIWMDLICAMHESGRCGKISGTPEQLARIGRCTVEEFLKSRCELASSEAANVSEANGIVTLTNRRMKREDKERKQTAKRVFRHRNRRDAEASNGIATVNVTPMKQHSSSSSSSSDKKEEEKDPPLVSPKGRSKKTKTVIADDWTIPADTLGWCADQHLPDPEYQRPMFINHFKSKGESRADWDASFRNWMLSPYRKDQINAKNGNRRGSPGPYESAAEKRERANAAFLRDLEEERSREDDPPHLHLGPPATASQGVRNSAA